MPRQRFDNSAFERSHLKQPRGFGLWAFFLNGDEANVVFAPQSMNLADAKRWAKAEHPDVRLFSVAP
jgi:hypothetical protein